MLYLVIDPAEKYVPKGNYQAFYPKDIPIKVSKANALRVALNSASIITGKRSVIINRVDKLNAKQVAVLVQLLYNKLNNVKVALTCVYERDVSKHIKTMPSIVTRNIRAPGFKPERNFYEKLTSYIQQKIVPENGLMLPFIQSMGNNPRLKVENQEILCDIDVMLFETDTEYLAYAWAGLHRPQKIRPLFKTVYSDKPKEVKIDPVIKKTRKAKKKSTVKKRRRIALSEYF